MKTAEVAATKIQAGFRGYKVRRQLREQSLDQSKEGGSGSGSEQSSHSAAAATAATDTPGQQCRGSYSHPMATAAVALDGVLEAALDEDLLQRSAARIQAGVRGFLVRRRQQNAAVAAAKIQAGFRGYRTRRELRQMKQRGTRSNSKGAVKTGMMAVRQAAQ